MDSSQRIRVAIHVPDPLYRAGLIEYLRRDHRLSEVPDDEIEEKDIIVVAVNAEGNSTLDMLRSLPGACAAKILLIVKDESTVDTSTAIAYGVRGILRYSNCTPTAFSRALLTIDAGGMEIPEPLKEMAWNRSI